MKIIKKTIELYNINFRYNIFKLINIFSNNLM